MALINFVDVTKVLNGYINGEVAPIKNISDSVKQLQETGEINALIDDLVIFTNRFAFAFKLKNGKIWTSKQCENCSLYNGKPISPNIVDPANPFYLVKDGKSRRLDAKTMEMLNKRIVDNKASSIVYTDFEKVKGADEFIYDSIKNEYIVYTDKISNSKPKYDNSRKEGYYVVYEEKGEIKLAFGNTHGVDKETVLYRGYDSFAAANKRYKQFCDDIKQ